MESNAQLNFILLGKKGAGKSSSGNTILGRQAFTTKKCSSSVTQDQTMGSGTVDGFSVTVYDTPGFFDPKLSEHEIQQKIGKVLQKSEVGEWAFLIVIKADSFTEEERITVKKIEKLLGERRFQKTWILFTRADELEDDNVTEQEFLNINGGLKKLVQKYDQRYHMFNNKKKGPSKQVKMLLTKIIQPFVKEKEIQTFGNQKLNMVFCGNYEILKESVSKLIEGEKTFLPPLHQKECVSKAVDLHGRLINVLELPALSRLSEEEVMHQSHQCVSLGDPGVHAFLFFISDAPLTEEDKAEMEEIQKIFSSKINKHMIIVNLKMNNQINTDPSSEISIQTFGARQFVLENSSQVPDLLQDVENMVEENSFYTSFMFLQAQIELERNKHKAEIEELKRFMMKTQATEADVTYDDDLRIVLLGKTGVGKSASANIILRKTAFKSALASKSVTRECQKDRAEFSRGRITVIDTPGLFDTGIDNAQIMKEIVKCVSMAAPGPHVFLLVISLVRFTDEEKDAVKMIQERFGDQSSMYTMVLFTRGDDLGGTSIKDFIEGDENLQNLIHQCGNRYHVFRNKETEDQVQVSELLEKIDRMVAENGGGYYTNEMFQQVEKNIREEQKRILMEKVEEIKRKEKELRDKYEAEMEQIKKETERKRQEMQDELRKKEEEFKKKEEEIKNEKDESLQKELQKKLEEQQKLLKEKMKKEKALEEQQKKHIKDLEGKHEKESQKLKDEVKRETREQAEREYRKKIDSIPYRSKRASDWGYYVPVVGAAAGGAVGTIEDVGGWIKKRFFS
uniref:GTPase IMAP family member 8-like n=1 Tax=Danio rerio TaxID=7955 RepID=A0A140LGH1_DANRE|nr:GTPase IMAP family member 8-like [Danio rerio]|eukprot:XP_689287.3 GTPase IMAP family member 8-like [Danio rerio]